MSKDRVLVAADLLSRTAGLHSDDIWDCSSREEGLWLCKPTRSIRISDMFVLQSVRQRDKGSKQMYIFKKGDTGHLQNKVQSNKSVRHIKKRNI